MLRKLGYIITILYFLLGCAMAGKVTTGFVESTPCLKNNVATIFFALCRVKYEPISVKLVGMSWNKRLTKLYIKCLLYLKHVLALPWEI